MERGRHPWTEHASTCAVFGGQGHNYFQELVKAYSKVELKDFIEEACDELLKTSRTIVDGAWYDKRFGLDVKTWINEEEPSREYLFSAPVSYPLIFVTQIVAYLDTLSLLGMQHQDALATGWLSATTGHSQGVLAAIVLSMSSTHEQVKTNALKVLPLLVALGLESHLTSGFDQQETLERSPMLAVRGLSREQLERLISETQKKLVNVMEQQPQYTSQPEAISQKTEMYVALRNGSNQYVVAGFPKALATLRKAIANVSAPEGDSQTRVPFSKRKPVTQTSFLSVTVPFHCQVNQPAVKKVLQAIVPFRLSLQASDLVLPCFETNSGKDLRTQACDEPERDLLELLIEMQLVQENDFVKTLEAPVKLDISHLVSYGPGESLARMCNQLVIGSGILVVDACLANTSVTSIDSLDEDHRPESELQQNDNEPHELQHNQNENESRLEIQPEQDVLTLDKIIVSRNKLFVGRSWEKEFSPRLVQRQCDGKLFVETKFTTTLGKPPVLMSGMTPTTSFLGIDLVSACSNAGFQGELAAGGLAIPAHFSSKIDELVSKLQPGVGISINMLYLNAHQWGFQFPMVLELAKSGYPIESITIGAGVPSPEKAEEIFHALQGAGISLIGFKPGSTQAIYDVLELAQIHPEMNVMLQWTSGRGGGHHSFEDFHEPLLETYAEIRRYENVILVVGSGFGDAQGAFPYLDGSWSQNAPFFRTSRMPVDAVLFGSRCMVAKEAATSLPVKQLIVDAPGILEEASWDDSYLRDTGGVVTVQSELGEPIHKIHTRGIRLWKKYDEKYFSLPRGPQREKAILADKDDIIRELNADFQKVYFGQAGDGTPVDLQEMTYAQLLRRMVQLMFVRDGGDPAGRLAPNRWIDDSYRTRTFTMMLRTERRFLQPTELVTFSTDASLLANEDPMAVIQHFILHVCPDAETTLLAEEDVHFFVDLCRDLRNGKPVNFIPLIDGDLSFWFKKDSLWCSEQIDAVPGRDPGRVCILHGPVAARYSTKIDEPIADILGDIHRGFIDRIERSGQATPVPVSLLGPKGAQDAPWHQVVVSTPLVVLGSKWVPNPIHRLANYQDYTIRIASSNCIEIIEKQPPHAIVANVTLQTGAQIILQVFDLQVPDAVLVHEFFFRPDQSSRPLHQSENLLDQVKSLYRKIWDCNEHVTLHDTFQDSCVLSHQDVVCFNRAIGRSNEAQAEEDPVNSQGSIDIATMAGWRPLIRALFADDLKGNLLKLVHLKHGYKLLPKQQDRHQVVAGEQLESSARVTQVEIQPGVGKKVRVEGTIRRSTKDNQAKYDWLSLFSEFLIRGDYTDFESTFRATSYEATVKCTDITKTALIKSKTWIKLSERIEVNDVLVFRLPRVEERGASATTLQDICVQGIILRQCRADTSIVDSDSDSDGFVDLHRGGKAGLEQVGIVSFRSEPGQTLQHNPVTSFLNQEKEPSNVGTMFESGGYQILPTPVQVQAPLESLSYAKASRDLNSIHRSRPHAILADLPEGKTIVHGMWTACMARQVVERSQHAADGDAARIATYEVEFVGMVFPGDQLCVTLQHVGVLGGRKLINIKVNKLSGSRELVMKGRAEIEQPKTAYLFTGQGSAAVGMGMDRYEESASVRKVWDTADRHLRQLYGFSILQIVKENPKALTIHFGGPKGKQIRDNYRKIRVEDPTTGKMIPLMKDIRANTTSFTFKSPQGLLFATQFSQPALVLVQKAAFEELVEGGFVPDDAVFAGHSLGEYAALASFADVLSIEALVETVFLRGMVMQNAVPRDASGNSDYGMVAANPSRVYASFTPEKLEHVVDLIGAKLQALIQIVNFNVRRSQYVVAGELMALDTLSEVLNAAAGSKQDASLESYIEVASKMAQENAASCKASGVPYSLRRGVATIPLAGIDVPFHSRKLLSGVPAFRQLLEPRLDVRNISNVIGRLVGKYIPNVIAEPFSLERAYAERVLLLTESPVLKSALQSGKYDSLAAADKAQMLVVELLAHQFAMPVQWIKTQDVMFHGKVQRVVEMGPAATLATMAKRTLLLGIYGDKEEYNPEILWWKQDSDAVFYNLEDIGPDFAAFADSLEPPSLVAESTLPTSQQVSEEQAPTSQMITVAVPPSMPSSAGAVHEDAPVSAKHVLRVLLATKFKKELSEIKDSVSIKDLSSGKSAVQNEVVGEISAEFGGQTPENGAEMSIAELGTKIGAGYSKLGKVSQKLINKVLSSALPGGFSPSAAKQFLTQDCGLGPGRVDSILVHSIICQPEKRLGSAPEAKKWLEQVRDAYAADAGISLAAPAGGAAPSPMSFAQAAPLQPVPDVPVSAKHALRVMLSLKFNKPLSEIGDNATVKELSSGKSAIQNEVVGELSAEFGTGPENAAELPIEELSTKFPGYTALGKVTTKAIGKMLGSKLPGGFSASSAKQHLAEERLLGPGRVDAVLLHGLTMQPGDRLATAAEAKQWLDKVCDSYSSLVGVSIPSKSSSAASGMVPQGLLMQPSAGFSSESMAKLLTLVETQLDAFNEFLGRSPNALYRELELEQDLRNKSESYVARLHAELGEAFCDGIQPNHSAPKVRTYDSFWNWVMQDALDLHCHVIGAISRAQGLDSGRGEGVFRQDEHYQAMAEWITAPSVENSQPPQAWFRNYLCNRATPELLDAVRYFSKTMHKLGQHEYAQVITLLAEQVEAWIHRVPVHVALFQPVAPSVSIDPQDGSIKYSEEARQGVADPVQYVEEMSRGLYYFRSSKIEVAHPSQSVQLSADAALHAEDDEDDDEELVGKDGERSVAGISGDREDMDLSGDGHLEGQGGSTATLDPEASGQRRPRSETELRESLSIHSSDLPRGPRLDAMRKTIERQGGNSPQVLEEEDFGAYDAPTPEDYTSIHVAKKVPFVHIKSHSAVDRTVRIINERLSSKYLSALHDIAVNGVSFAGQVALITGAGRGSIAEEIVKAMLEGGATVICTLRTSRTEDQMKQEYKRFRQMYEEFGAKGSKLILEPSNCASSQDMEALVQHIYEGLGLDVDFVIPFAAVAERGKDISDIDSHSEMAHRMMLTNVVRLLGLVKRAKEERSIETRPAMVLVPCSPNHGEFGNDGLYAESKLGCESLVNKWASEGWGNYLCIAAAVIGWTRSALMWQNNIVAPGIEQLGCRTFSTAEMTFNLLGLLHPRMVTLAANEPLWADLTGNWISVPDLNTASQKIRARLQENARLMQSKLKSERAATQDAPSQPVEVSPLANPRKMCPAFPKLPVSLDENLQGMVDLRQVVVVVGYGEVGPWGNARTRWEMEAFGEFSLEGAIELAWIVGLIKPFNGQLADNPTRRYIGWVDAETGQAVPDHEVKRRYEKTLLKHCGIRIIEPELFEGYDPEKKTMMHRVAIDRDMPAMEVASREEAQQYRREIGDDLVDIFLAPESEDRWMIRIKKGAVISVPKAMRFDRRIAGQLPTGWDAKRLGVPPEIVDSVDPVTLFTIVSTVEALVNSGLTDAYELYEYVHVSQVGNVSGGGMGGMRSLKRMFFDRKMDEDIPSDTLAESFINTMPAWVNMLLLSSSGPIKTPVGACATAAESVDIGVETIQSGKARVVLAGGYDDFGETGSYEFAQMGATNNSDMDQRKGRAADESSRPMTQSRAGFVEAQGAGIQVLMDAELAIEMGCPIYAVVALTSTATDKQGRSIPAPGRGILTTARESGSGSSIMMLDLAFRRENLAQELSAVDRWKTAQQETLVRIAEKIAEEDGGQVEANKMLQERMQVVEKMARKKRAAAQECWGQGFYKDDPSIAPLRGALSVWGLDVDDIAVASFHGTSTKLNDKNESAVVNKQMEHLGRAKGNVLLVIAQKYLTGHPKGAACAWMLNGMIQSMLSGVVPGNRNLDNVSPELRSNGYLLYPNRSIQLQQVKAAVLKSFGFGQAGAEIVLVHPDRVLSVLSASQFERYKAKRDQRERKMFRYMQGVFTGKHSLVQVKDSPPYSANQEEDIYLDPTARATFNSDKGTWSFPTHPHNQRPVPDTQEFGGSSSTTTRHSSSLSSSSGMAGRISAETRLRVTLEENANGLSRVSLDKGIGVDVEPVETFANPTSRLEFLKRNFTPREIEYCLQSPSPEASFAGRWAAKEAVVKAISSASGETRSLWQGADAPLRDIEVMPGSSGAPQVQLLGHAQQVFQALQLSTIKVSISHTATVAVAQAVAL